MAAVIDRKTGEVIQMPSFTNEEKEAMVQVMLRHYLQKNPQVILEALESTTSNPDLLRACSVTS